MASPRAVSVAIIFALAPTDSDSTSTSLTHAVAASDEEPTFLLVSSRKRKNRYVFPKGGIEYGERPAEAAEREAWEEGETNPRGSSAERCTTKSSFLAPGSRTPTRDRKTPRPLALAQRPVGTS